MIRASQQIVFRILVTLLLPPVLTFATDAPTFIVGDREVVATTKQRDALGLKWFMDGNLGVLKEGSQFRLYGANGPKPVRVTGTLDNLFQKVEPVTILTTNEQFQYLSGGPLYRDPESGRIFLFYHAEIHRGTAKNFYSVLGLSVQTDEQGLEFKDVGPIFVANVSNQDAESTIEVCGTPYMIRDGYFYVYARDVSPHGDTRGSNLSVARATVSEVVQAGLEGKRANWTKYYNNAFSETAIGGSSSPLERGNPNTRWMDVSYNTVRAKYLMVFAANTFFGKTELFVSWSDDGIIWTDRRKLADENGESFYPSIIGFGEDSRQTGAEFFIYYTFSVKGGWNRWSDAVIARRKITITEH